MQEKNYFPAQGWSALGGDKNPGPQKNTSRRRVKLAVIFCVVVIALVGIFLFWKGARTLTIIRSVGNTEDVGSAYPDFTVKKEANRIDILLLGLRGADDPNGGLLTDTMLLLSYDTQTGKAALVSIPRDLYVSIPGVEKKQKINTAYAIGEVRTPGGGGLELSKAVVSYVTGVYVDYAVSVNFEAFQKFIDMVGGSTVTRTTPLIEDKQWQFEGKANDPYWHIATDPDGSQHWVFEVPMGTHTLNGIDTLYYVRSRYTTSDFDRMKREQEVIKNLSEKFLSFGTLGNPVRLSQTLDIFGSSVRTDIDFQQMYAAATTLAPRGWQNIHRAILDISPSSFLTQTTSDDGQYILLPRDGTFHDMRIFFQNILTADNSQQ